MLFRKLGPKVHSNVLYEKLITFVCVKMRERIGYMRVRARAHTHTHTHTHTDTHTHTHTLKHSQAEEKAGQILYHVLCRKIVDMRLVTAYTGMETIPK